MMNFKEDAFTERRRALRDARRPHYIREHQLLDGEARRSRFGHLFKKVALPHGRAALVGPSTNRVDALVGRVAEAPLNWRVRSFSTRSAGSRGGGGVGAAAPAAAAGRTTATRRRRVDETSRPTWPCSSTLGAAKSAGSDRARVTNG